MVKILFKTNLDAYSSSDFPNALPSVPRKGDFVEVNDKNHFLSKGLPTRLEVVSVTWSDTTTVCELWYNETDKKLAEAGGVKTL